MSEQEILKHIEDIDKQLAVNRKTLDPYLGKMLPFDPKIEYLVKLTRMLIEARTWLCNKLLKDYGVFVMTTNLEDI